MSQYNNRGGLGGERWALVGAVGALLVVCAVGAVILYLNGNPLRSALAQSPPTVDIDALVADAAATVAARVTPASAPVVLVSTSSAPEEVDLSASLSEITGKVEFKQAGEEFFSPAYAGAKLKQGGQIQTGDDGKVRLDLSSGTIVRVTPSSIFTLTANEKADRGLATRIKLDVGWIFIILTGGSADVETPAGVAAVRGSYMSVRYSLVIPSTVSLTCLEGSCSVTSSGRTVNFTNGQKVILTQNINGQWSAPSIVPMSSEDYQDWMIFGLNSPPPQTLNGLIAQGLGTTTGQFASSVVINAGQTAGVGGVCEFTAGSGNINSSSTLLAIGGATTLPNISSQGCRIAHISAPDRSTICFAAIPNQTSNSIYFLNGAVWERLSTTINSGKACASGSPNPAGEYRIGIP